MATNPGSGAPRRFARGLLLMLAAIGCGDGAGGTPPMGSAGTGQSTGGTAGTGAPGGSGGQGTAGGSSGGVAGTGQSGAGGGAGAAGISGTGGTGGTTPLGPGLTDPSTFTIVSCTISPTVTIATGVGMVGIATFTTDLAGAERAVIQFGKTSSYTLEAPVDWADVAHRTLLLGMPANTTVHYRVVVIRGRNACVGADATYMTGTVSGAPANVTPTKGTSTVAPAPGFIVAENGPFAYIVNDQGEVVWAHAFPISLSPRADVVRRQLHVRARPRPVRRRAAAATSTASPWTAAAR